MALVMLASGVQIEPPRKTLVHTRHLFTSGFDGSQWDLCSDETGVVFMDGIRGMLEPEATFYRSESAQDGARFRGLKYNTREVFWPVEIYAPGEPEAWFNIHSRLTKALNPQFAGRWTVQAPGQDQRHLQIRYRPSDGGLDIDPSFFGWADRGLYFDAEWPFWQSDPITRTWGVDTSGDNWLQPGSGFYWELSSSYTAAEATIDNPGDVAASPVWRLNGPFTNAAVGADGQVITIPFAVPAGEWVTIDCRPDSPTAYQILDSDGDSRTADVGPAQFARIDPGEEVELSITMNGAGSVQLDLTPNYLAAW